VVTWKGRLIAERYDKDGVTLSVGQSAVNFTPVAVKSRLPDPSTQPWPMGDVLPREPPPPEIDAAKLEAAVNAAFQPAEGLAGAQTPL
jgi:hypothetical protein